MAVVNDQEGMIKLLEDEATTLPPVPVPVPVSGNGNGNGRKGTTLEISPEEEWQTDPVSVKWNKIRAAFLNGKAAVDVKLLADSMSDREWLDWVVKMAPKDVRVVGEISFKHLLAELGPIDKEKYRPAERVVEAEFSEVRE